MILITYLVHENIRIAFAVVRGGICARRMPQISRQISHLQSRMQRNQQ